MGMRGTKDTHIADIQEALNDWQETDRLFDSYSAGEEDEAGPMHEATKNAIKVAIASQVFDLATDRIYEAIRSASKYGGPCDCKEPKKRARYSCENCYGNIGDA